MIDSADDASLNPTEAHVASAADLAQWGAADYVTTTPVAGRWHVVVDTRRLLADTGLGVSPFLRRPVVVDSVGRVHLEHEDPRKVQLKLHRIEGAVADRAHAQVWNSVLTALLPLLKTPALRVVTHMGEPDVTAYNRMVHPYVVQLCEVMPLAASLVYRRLVLLDRREQLDYIHSELHHPLPELARTLLQSFSSDTPLAPLSPAALYWLRNSAPLPVSAWVRPAVHACNVLAQVDVSLVRNVSPGLRPLVQDWLAINEPEVARLLLAAPDVAVRALDRFFPPELVVAFQDEGKRRTAAKTQIARYVQNLHDNRAVEPMPTTFVRLVERAREWTRDQHVRDNLRRSVTPAEAEFQKSARFPALRLSGPLSFSFAGQACVAEPLLSSSGLAAENRRMGHCVNSFAPDCVAGLAFIYAISGSDGLVATAEFDSSGALLQLQGRTSDARKVPDGLADVLRAMMTSRFVGSVIPGSQRPGTSVTPPSVARPVAHRNALRR